MSGTTIDLSWLPLDRRVAWLVKENERRCDEIRRLTDTLIEPSEPPGWLTERERLLYEQRETMARLAKIAKAEGDTLREQLRDLVAMLGGGS